MKQALLDLLESKKFLVAMGAIIVAVGGRFGLHIDPAVLDRIDAALLMFVGAQGVADIGKPAAKIAAVSAGTSATTTTGETK